MNIRKLSPLIGAAAVAVLLAGCAYGDDHHHNFRTAGVDYDGYYDDAYGPITDGYWGSDGVFYFAVGGGHTYRRDDDHHIQRDQAPGRHNIHGHHNDDHDGQ
jgi:hypothetical protein